MGAMIPDMVVTRLIQNRKESLQRALPDALDLAVVCVEAGLGLDQSLVRIGQELRPVYPSLSDEFNLYSLEVNAGKKRSDALRNLGQRTDVDDIKSFAAVLIQKEAGGNLTEILEKVSVIIREEYKLRRQIRVHTAQGRMTGWILSLLPPGLGILMYLSAPEFVSLLWTRPLGLKLLYGAVLMTTIGALIIRKIINVRI
jgi:tight adherence protein B